MPEMPDRLLTAREQLNLHAHEAREGVSTREAHLAWHRAWASREGKAVLHPDAAGALDRDAAPAVAYVNHGRWVADCPAADCTRCRGRCGAALNLLPESHFWCPCCHNVELGGRWRRVQWPPATTHRALEHELVKRPTLQHRNWEPGRHSLAGLRRETRALQAEATAAAGAEPTEEAG